MNVIGSVTKGADAEIRVVRDFYKGRDVVDVRVWFEPRAGGERVRSGKGITFDARKLPELIAVLEKAQGVTAPDSKERKR